MEPVRETSQIFYNNVNDFLGNPAKRYLAKRFADIHFEITSLSFSIDSLSSEVIIDKINSIGYMHKKHFGSIEALSIASTLTELFLIGKFNLEERDIDYIKVKEISFKVKKSNESPNFKSSILCTSLDNNKKLYKFIASVQNFTIIFLIHIPFTIHNTWNTISINQYLNNLTQKYNFKGYKKSRIEIKNLFLNITQKKINSSYSIHNNSIQHGLTLGKPDRLTQIDFIRISGQMIQTLLYNLEGINRECASNMWVKSLRIIPSKVTKKEAEITFTDFTSLTLRNQKWRIIDSCIHIGELKGNMKVCHKIN